MNQKEFETRMRLFEKANDPCVPPGMFIVARLDGRGFTQLIRNEIPHTEAFSLDVRDYMHATTVRLMTCGFRVIYACTHSDEISLLFHREEDCFGRNIRKFLSTLAGEASSTFTHNAEVQASFDCRILQFGRNEDVIDYFQWRIADSEQNALFKYCAWVLQEKGLSRKETHRALLGKGYAEKIQLLSDDGIDFKEATDPWMRRGSGLHWEYQEITGRNPLLNTEVTTVRRKIKGPYDLPEQEEYSRHLYEVLT